jgi:cyclic-di-AMP phosphodiesterase PgpH
VELNDNQNLNPKKARNPNPAVLEFASKAIGVFRLPSFREGLLITICFGLLITLLQLNLFPRTFDIKVGQASKIEVKSPRDVVDREATRQAQEEAVNGAMEIVKQDPDYYQIDESVARMSNIKMNRFFEIMDRERDWFAKHKMISKEFSLMRVKPFFYGMPDAGLLTKILVLPVDQYLEVKKKSVQVLEEIELHQRIDTKSLALIKMDLPQLMNQYHVSAELTPVINKLVEAAISPNLIPDAPRIARLKNQVRSEVPKIMRHRGELLIAKNQVVTENDLKMLKDLHLIINESNRFVIFLSLSFFVLFLIILGWVYIFQFHPQLFKEERLLYLLLMLLLLVVGLIKVLSLTENPALTYLAPVSFAAMLITILIDPQVALAMTIILSLLGGIIVDYNLALTIFYFTSGVIAVFTLSHFQRQRDLVRSGSLLMILNGITALVLTLLFGTNFDFWAILLATTNGFLSAVLAIGSLPFLEHIFKITSPIRLLELSNPGHPLLRRLQIEAPGTYHHSIMVGNLAEAAAEGIGADALWVRVGSYYHDIGKIKRPYFFVENQFSQENPHEKLNPTLSTLVITYHVKEGAEIAREHGLPDKLIEIIEQHHGTDLVRYFYKRAADNLQGEKEVLLEEDFRYEGPKPQTKEAALVMLADSVEAAVKSLPKPTPSKVETLVQKIIRERLDDGQFDECNLTLKDLNKVKISFIKVLGGLFHNRIEYPENVLKEIERKKTSADPAK